VEAVADVRAVADVVVLELPGGLFSPVTERAINADLAQALQPDDLLVVVPDRLGALHEAIATQRAAAAMSLRIGGFVLVTPSARDASTGYNAKELPAFVDAPVLAALPRAPVDELARLPAIASLARRIQGAAGRDLRP
jgi:dethiobiotin synthetase